MAASLPTDAVRDMLVGKLGATVETKARGRKGQRDHTKYKVFHEGRVVAQTHMSLGSKHKVLGDDLIQSMARQLLVPTRFFVEMASCAKGRDEYIELLRQQSRL